MRALRIGLGSVASLALVAGISLAVPTAALASSGFTEKAATTYVVNPERQRLDVTIDLTFKNTKAPTATTIYSYNSEFVWLEKDATNIKATGTFSSMRITKEKTSGQYSEYRFHWEPVVFYGKTKSLHITYQIPTGAPRSSSWFRISPAYLDFCVIGTGLDGGSTTVKVPTAYTMSIDEQDGATFRQSIDGDYEVYKTGTLEDASTFWGCLSGERAGKYTTTRATSPSGREIDIEAWPDDPTWATQVNAQLDPVLRDLEAVVGTALPGDGPIGIREVGVGTLGQYAGFFDADSGIARIGEDLEAKGLIAHELSHAWFNGRLFEAHWLSEGYAEWARISVDPDTCPAPTSFPGKGSPNLEAWRFAGPKATDEDLDVVDYQYAAACAIVSETADRIGADGMRRVIAALIQHENAYQGGAGVMDGEYTAATWQIWLDVVDEYGLASKNTATSVATVADLLAPYGITSSAGTATLKSRAEARLQFHALQAQLGDWVVPPVILRPMARWSFDHAATSMAAAARVHDAAAQLSSVLPSVDGLNGKARTLLEGAHTDADLDAALAAANDRLDAARAVAAAQTAMGAPRDAAMTLGLLGMELQPTLDAAVQAIKDEDTAAARANAQAVTGALANAAQQGQLRLVLAVAVPVLLVLLVLFLLWRRRRRRATVALVPVGGPALAALDVDPAPPPGIEPRAIEPRAIDVPPASPAEPGSAPPPAPPPEQPPSS